MKQAVLKYVTPPTEAQLAGLKAYAEREAGEEVTLLTEQDLSLKSGFILRVNSREFDWSEKGRIRQLKEALRSALKTNDNGETEPAEKTADAAGISHEETDRLLISLRKKMDEFTLLNSSHEVGTVLWVGDGICNAGGIDHARYGEIVVFDSGIKGMVQDIRRDEVGIVLFGSDSDIRAGSRVARTETEAGIPVGSGYLGRMVDALGAPLDDGGEITAEDFYPLERPAPGIMDRESVREPMETGILAIDSMFPIGRGQRELIIGDRQTGKTSIAMDTILNQKGKNVVCIYVAIGQKASTVARLVNNLKQTGAMEYTTVVCSTASDPAPLQYIAPYSGTALAEYFMEKGRDVLIVYDDLSKHAVAYRAISLLLERSPGREAYPGDVFYLHSRLLERSSRMSEEKGGGSITALPIIETQAGDVSAYIPTNVISITDGQIYLESELFFSGQRPAVNVGLSVSRVGGAAQTKAMKKAAGTLRIDLAQYREMEVFTQFSSELDENTKKQLAHGKALMELLKQPLGAPLSMEEQVVLLVTAGEGVFDGLSAREVSDKKQELLSYMHEQAEPVFSELREQKLLTDETRRILENIAAEFKAAKEAE